MLKTILFLSALSAILFGNQAHAAVPTKVAAVYDRVYVPKGFDSNDLVQIVGSGRFENGCYRPAETSVRVDEAQKRILLSPAAYKYHGLCLQIRMDFERVIDVGVVPPGEYAIFQEGHDKQLGTLNVREAMNEEPDDYLYAPISQAFLDDRAGSQDLVIKGEFPSSCMHIKEVKLEAVNQVIIAQPIVEMKRTPDCALGFYPFTETVKVSVPKGRYLLHVRSMNSKAINNLVSIP